MADFFLELFSEEIPANLQKTARSTVLESFKKLFEANHAIKGRNYFASDIESGLHLVQNLQSDQKWSF